MSFLSECNPPCHRIPPLLDNPNYIFVPLKILRIDSKTLLVIPEQYESYVCSKCTTYPGSWIKEICFPPMSVCNTQYRHFLEFKVLTFLPKN